MHKVYLASRFDRHMEMEGYAHILQNLGFVITSGWHSLNAETKMRDGDTDTAFNEKIAFADQMGIYAAHIVVNFSEDPKNPPQGSARGGRHVELGLAMGWGKLVFVVGPRENVFHYLPEITVFPASGEEFIQYMKNMFDPCASKAQAEQRNRKLTVSEKVSDITRAYGFTRDGEGER